MTRQEKLIEIAKERDIKYLVFDLDDKQNELKDNDKIYKNISYIIYDVKNNLYKYYDIEDILLYVSEEPLVIFTNKVVYIHDDDLCKQFLILNNFKELLMCKYIVD
ncbi:hypothetical protein [Romboutsia ilealis]|uniref:hypothetical protein n=1 Tax=Romboutsia ilealis TaxID=1115758 RepID=UPI0025707DF0|nr:hypothetical protein [Romboutsia ilealis]